MVSIREGPVQGDRKIGRCRFIGQAFPSTMMLSLRLAFLLFKWKAVDTVLDLLSFNLQFWRYDDSIVMPWLRVFSNEDHSAAECTIAKTSA